MSSKSFYATQIRPTWATMNPFLREKKKKDTTKEPIYNTVSSPKAGQKVKL